MRSFFVVSVLFFWSSFALSAEIYGKKILLSELAIIVAEYSQKPIFVAANADAEVTVVNRYLDQENSLWYLEKIVELSGLSFVQERDAIFINTPEFDQEVFEDVYVQEVDLISRTYEVDPLSLDDSELALTALVDSLDSTMRYKDNLSVKSTVTALQGNSSLLVVAPSEYHDQVRFLLDSLKPRTKQINVKAVIYESVIGSSDNLGLQLAYKNGVKNLSISKGVVNLLGGGLAVDFGVGSLSVLASALNTEANTEVLSMPSLSLLNGESAYLTVGDNIPIITGSQQTDSGQPFQTITRQDVGVSLSVTANILPDNLVRLVVDQEASSLSDSEVSASDVITSKRQLQTTLVVRSGEQVSLGGLIKVDKRRSKSQVPFFSDLPVVGKAFNYDESSDRKTVLNILMTVDVSEV